MKSKFRHLCSLSIAALLTAPVSQAVTYTFTVPDAFTTGSDNWSTDPSGVIAPNPKWSAVPVSASDTSLVFTLQATGNSQTQTTGSVNDIANPFQLNSLTFNSNPSAGNGSQVVALNISGSPLDFVSNGATTPQVNLSGNRSNGQLVNFAVSNNIVLTNNTLFTGNGTASFTISGAISGAGTFTKSGTSTLVLSGANSYDGGTSINAGTLSITSTGTLGQNVNTNNVSLNAGGLLNLTAAGNTGANQTITLTSTAGSLATLGLGYNGIPAATIVQADTNGGVIAINSVVGYNQNLSTVLSGKNLFLGGIGTTSTFTGAAGTIAAGNDSTYRLGDGGGSISFNTANLFTGANFVQIGSTATGGTGTVIIGAAQNYTGATTVTAGTLSVSAANNLGGASADLVFDGGTLRVTGTALTSLTSLGRTNPVVFNSTKTVGLDIADAGNTFTVGQVLNQTTGGFTKSGAGTAILDQNNTFTGAVNLNAGTLQLRHANAIDTATAVNAVNGTTLQLRNNNATIFNTPLTTLSSTGGATLTIDVNRVSSGTGNQLTLNGGLSSQQNHGNENNINFTGGNSYTLSVPTLSINRFGSGGGGGGLHLNANSTSVSIGAATLNSTQGFFVDLAGTTTGNTMGAMDQVTGTFSLRKSGSGTWRVNGSSDFTGTTSLTGGVLEVEVMANGGSNSGVGRSTNAANQLLLNNATTLRYVGSANALPTAHSRSMARLRVTERPSNPPATALSRSAVAQPWPTAQPPRPAPSLLAARI